MSWPRYAEYTALVWVVLINALFYVLFAYDMMMRHP